MSTNPCPYQVVSTGNPGKEAALIGVAGGLPAFGKVVIMPAVYGDDVCAGARDEEQGVCDENDKQYEQDKQGGFLGGLLDIQFFLAQTNEEIEGDGSG